MKTSANQPHTAAYHPNTIEVGRENSTPIHVYYEDHGSGLPVVLLSGYPFGGTAWEKQTTALLAAGYRVITIDRRGFGNSSRPGTGYDFDTLASDLNTVLTSLDLTEVSLVGSSMGTGEIHRYIGKYGTKRLRRVALIGTMGPFWLKTADNPEGVDRGVFDGLKTAIQNDRPAALLNIIQTAFNYDVLGGKLVSERVIEDCWNIAVAASPIAAVKCIEAWQEDFRQDLPHNRVPTLIVHAGDTDRVLPPDIHSRRLAKVIKQSKLIELPDAPHNIHWTHADRVNEELIKFLGAN